MIRFLLWLILFNFSLCFAYEMPVQYQPLLEGLPENCENGFCLDQLIEEYQAIEMLAVEQQCVPESQSELTDDQIREFYGNRTIDQNCLDKLRKLEELAEEINQVVTILEAAQESIQQSCRELSTQTSAIENMEEVVAETQNMCLEQRKMELRQQCAGDIGCAVSSTATSIIPGGVFFADKLFGDSLPRCNFRDDSCLTQLITGFVNAVWQFLKFILTPLKNAVVSGWNSLWGIEEETSSRHLALAQASEEEGVLDQIIQDPIGSVKKMGGALLETFKSWLANDAYCQEWSGVAHYSECLRPWQGFECSSCKAMINGSCHLAGAFLSEVVPAFLTGGLFNAVKYGATAGRAFAKSLKVSDRVSDLAKNSAVGRGIARTIDAGKDTARLIVASGVSTGASRFIRQQLGKVRQMMKAASLLKNSRVLGILSASAAYMVYEGGKQVVVFAGNSMLTLGKIVIYPIENPLTQKAFQLGMDIGRGTPVVSGGLRSSLASSENINKLDEIDQAYIRSQQTQGRIQDLINSGRNAGEEYRQAIEEFETARASYLETLKLNRDSVFKELAKGDSLQDIVAELFPELRYSDDLARSLSSQSIRQSEAQLNRLIRGIQDSEVKTRLVSEFNELKAAPSRRELNLDEKVYYSEAQVRSNSEISNNVIRFERSFEEVGFNPEQLDPVTRYTLVRAFEDAHNIGRQGVFNYTPTEIAQKYRLLREAGLNQNQADRLIRSGLMGRAAENASPTPNYFDQIKLNARFSGSVSTSDLNDFENLIDFNRAQLEQGLRSGDIRHSDLEPTNLIRLRSGKTNYVGIKTDYGIEVFEQGVQVDSGRRISAVRNNQNFQASDGTVIRKNVAGEYEFSQVPRAKDSFEEVLENLRASSKSLSDQGRASYLEFLNSHADKIKSSGLPSEFFEADNFRLATHTDSGERFYIFGKPGPGQEIPRAFAVSNGKSSLIDNIYPGEYTLHLSDGSAIQYTSRSERHFDEAITDDLIKDQGWLRVGDQDSQIKREFISKYRDDLARELRSYRMKPADISTSDIRYFHTDDGQRFYALRVGQVEDTILIPVERFEIKNLNDVLSENIARGSFSHGETVRRFQMGERTEFVTTASEEALVRANYERLLKDTSIQSRSNTSLREYHEFLEQQQDLIQKTINNGDLRISDLASESIFTSRIGGENVFVVAGRDQTLILNPQKRILPGLGSDEVYLYRDIGEPDLVLRSLDNDFEVSSLTRNTLSAPQVTYRSQEVLNHSRLSLAQRETGIEDIIGGSLNSTQKQAIESIVEGNIFRDASVFNYSQTDLRNMREILLRAGFDPGEIRPILESGYLARPPRWGIGNSQAFFAEDFSRMNSRSFSEYRDELRLNLNGSRSRGPQYTSEQAQRVVDNIEALYFIDYSHYSRAALDLLEGKTDLHRTNIFSKYNKNNQRPFENFQRTSRWMREDRPDVSLNTLRRTHASMMEGGIENMEGFKMGQIRRDNTRGNIAQKDAITEIEIENINSNPYTSWNEFGKAPSGKSYGEIQYPNINALTDEALERLSKVNPELAAELRQYRANQVRYTDIMNRVNQTDNAMILKSNRMTVLQSELKVLQGIEPKAQFHREEITRIQKELTKNTEELKQLEQQKLQRDSDLAARAQNILRRNNKITEKIGEKNQQLLEGLAQERMQWFNERRSLLGILDSPEKVDDYVDLVAEFQRDLVSIHPFENGNGRTARQFALNYLLEREGLPPARIIDPNGDILMSLSEWQMQVRQGVIASQNLIEDLVRRSRIGLPLEQSPHLIAPVDKSKVLLGMYADNTKVKWHDALEMEDLNTSQYQEFLRQTMRENPRLRAELKSDPIATWNRMNERAMQLYRENNIYYDYRRNGKRRIERLRVGVPDQDFRHFYGQSTISDTALYNFKMDEFYTDDIVWRGLATVKGNGRARSDNQIAALFKNFDQHMTSNRVARKGKRKADQIKSAAVKDLDEYQRAVFNDPKAEGDLATITAWHAEAFKHPDRYNNSIGYSTSRNKKVGEDFALGALQVGEYRKLEGDKVSEYLKPENQASVAQSLLIGERVSKTHHVDMMRLKKLRPDFSYAYFRQAEVMGIGAADPEAIRIIQVMRVDEKGKRVVEKSFVRDPDFPSLIHIVAGPAEEGVRPAPADIIKTIDLNQ